MADSFSPNGAQAPAPRKRMVFTKRDPEAAAKLEAERLAGVKSVRLDKLLRDRPARLPCF